MLLGMALAFGASIFWTISPVCFAAAGRRIGAYNVNVLRLVMAGLFLAAIGFFYSLFAGGLDLFIVPKRGFLCLVLSGLSGLVIGDMFYLKSLTMLGPRRTTQFITLAPILPVIFAWIILGEALSWSVLLGIAMIIGGIAYIVFHDYGPIREISAEPGMFSIKGIIIAIVSVLFHSMGAVMARWAFIEAPDIDPIIATTIRVSSSGVIIALVSLLRFDFFKACRTLSGLRVFSRLTGGVLTGPVVGMIFYIAAFKYEYAGVVTTLSGFSPVLILPVIAIRYRARIPKEAVIGAVATVVGAGIMGLFR